MNKYTYYILDTAPATSILLLLSSYRDEDDVTAQTLNALGEASASLGNMSEARLLFMECYTIRINVLGEKHMDTASVMKNLATVAFASNAYTEAREMALGALRIYRMQYGPQSTHECIIPVLSDLGEIYQQLGNVTEANGKHQTDIATIATLLH